MRGDLRAWLGRHRFALAWVGSGLGVVWLWWWRRIEAHISLPVINLLNFDEYAYDLPTWEFGFRSLREGHLPLWNPWQMCGTPFFSTPLHMLLYPLNLPFLALPIGPAMKWSTILHLVLAFVGTAALARELGLRRLGAAVWAIGFTFCGSMVALVYITTHLFSAAWMPLALLLAHRVVAGRRRVLSGVLLGMVFAFQYLAGYPMYGLMTGYVVGLYLLERAVRLVRSRQSRALVASGAALALGAVIAVGLTAPQLLPALDLAQRSPRNLSAMSAAAADPLGAQGMTSSLPVALLQNMVLPGWNAKFPRIGGIGLVGFVLAAFAFSNPGKRALVWYLATLAVLSWTLSLGVLTPLYRVYVDLPTGAWFRVPPRFLFVTSFALAGLAGIGADLLSSARLAADRRRFLWLVPLAVYVELSLAFVNLVPIPQVDPDFYRLEPAVAQFLREHQGFERTYFTRTRSDRGMPSLPPKAGMTERVYAAAGQEHVFPARYGEYAAFLEDGDVPSLVRPSMGEVVATADSPGLPLLDLMGVRFVVESPVGTFQPTDRPERYPVVFRGDGLRVLENPGPVPRVRFVERVEVISEPAKALALLASADHSPLTTVVLEEPPPPAGKADPAAAAGLGPSPEVEIEAYEAESVRIRVAAPRPGFLVLTDTWDPGWRAEVDGREVPILQADYLFRAVPLPAGRHQVRFSYFPWRRPGAARASAISPAVSSTADASSGHTGPK